MSTVTTKDGIENMSLVPGRPGHDELVPSRYAQKVGAIDVLVISDGVLPIPARTIAHNIEPAVRAAWLEHEFLSPEMLEWPLNVVVVRSGGRTMLIDAGVGMDPGLNLPQAGRVMRRLEAAGIDLASVTDVVLTHMHMDHIGAADPRGGRRAQVLGVARFLACRHAGGIPGRAAAGGQAVRE